MRRSIILALIIALTVGTEAARASSILYFNDLSRGIDQMADGLAALSATYSVTVATSTADFATKIASGGYDMGIFFQQVSAGDSGYEAAWAALRYVHCCWRRSWYCR